MASSSELWVAVRYADYKTESVMASRVKDLNPKSLHDFDSDKIYKIKTGAWNAKGHEETYEGIVEGLGVSKKGAEASRRGHVENTEPSLREKVLRKLRQCRQVPVSNSSDCDFAHPVEIEEEKRERALSEANVERSFALLESIAGSSNCKETSHNRADCASDTQGENSNNVSREQKKCVKRKQILKPPNSVKRAREERKLNNEAQEEAEGDWETFFLVHHESSAPPPIEPTTASAAAIKPLSSQTDMSTKESIASSQSSNSEISSKSSQSARCTLSSKDSISSGCSALCNNRWEELNSRIQAMERKFEAKFDQILELLQGREQQGPHVLAFGKQVINGQVVLHDNLTCSEINWRSMNTVSDTPEWCVAILLGTFKEDAMFYRVQPRCTDSKAFPKPFLTAARVYYEDFLSRRVKELQERVRSYPMDLLAQEQHNFFKDNRDRLLEQLPAALADKADGLYRQHKKNLKKAGIDLPERERRAKESSKEKKKSTYRRILTTPKSLQPRKNSKKSVENEENFGSPCRSPHSLGHEGGASPCNEELASLLPLGRELHDCNEAEENLINAFSDRSANKIIRDESSSKTFHSL